ncbi:3-dehydro-L-gulonate 2-dehydrogenase [Terriglobus aquaticus]|uniref:3-dehydro-L-gulonate 2-dehydrogenase n=1 Tax=Terriglobus aquaticus TaxID=940139 RepID=A0ABW9KJJ2_9BACT|nr:3-dehydro-L-gulonate 2-dehydrogenase [Terriglobus aquaticus]
MARVTFAELKQTILQAFLNAGMSPEDAETCAQIHTETTADGVTSHGINRVPRFVDFIAKGYISLGARPQPVKQLGALEVWDGQRAPGILNALFATDRAMHVAAEQGIALIGLRNTNHWMRGGTYGWRAANSGFVLIAWTNTESCMPAWGGKDPRLGNNPFIMAAPRQGGPVVLDMAMSQYSYGKLQVTRLKGERLPYPGGFDSEGHLTDEPGPIEQSQRILPMGMWKGSGFAILLDLLAAILSEGLPTNGIDALRSGSCVGCSQVFLAVDPRKLGGAAAAQGVADSVVDYVHASIPNEENRPVDYPGEGAVRRRERSMRDGMDVDDSVWAEVQALASHRQAHDPAPQKDDE